VQHPGPFRKQKHGTPEFSNKVFTGLSAHCRYGQHVSAQRSRSAVEAAHRSIHPNIPGVPWWAALLIATTATTVGFAIDAGSGHKELTDVFATLYIAGCVAAVLAVRQSGVFTTVIQPPLILFCAVPGAYWLFHGGKVSNLKDLLINCGYPLIERFPLMLGTAGVVLLIGLIRWYFGLSHRTTAPANTTDDVATTTTESESKSVVRGIAAKLASILGRDEDDENAEAPAADAPRVHAVSDPPKTGRAARGSRSAQRTTRTRSRHSRPPLEQEYEPPAERRRRASRRDSGAERDLQPADPPRRSRRRSRPQGDPELRAQPPRERRRDSYGRRSAYERPASRSSRFDSYAEHFTPYEKPYEPYEPYEPPRRRATPNGPNSASPTHHPISQVRYRGSPSRDEPRDEHGDEPRAERRSRSRAPRRHQSEDWEYDI
jgi:hypothetical protein